MFELLKQRIAELNRELATLNEDHDRLSLEAKKWAERRDSIHGQVKSLRTEAADLKEKRDKLNARVQELKTLREQAKTELRERNAQILELKAKLGVLMEKKPPKSMHEIQKEIESLEWRIQTTHLTLEEEKSLIDRVRPLEAQLLVHNQILKLKDALVKLKTEREALGFKAKLYHERLSELAEQSQAFHETMLEILNRIHAFQAEADTAHQKYVQTKQQAQDFRQKHVNLSHQIKILKQKLHQAEEERQAKRRLEIRKELEEKALEKLSRGGKLTWEEFKILAEQGIL